MLCDQGVSQEPFKASRIKIIKIVNIMMKISVMKIIIFVWFINFVKNDKLLGQMHRILHQPNGKAPLCQEEDTGDSFIEMILQPSVMDEVDSKEKIDKADEEKESEEEEEQEEFGVSKKQSSRSKRLGSEKKKRLKDDLELDDSAV